MVVQVYGRQQSILDNQRIAIAPDRKGVGSKYGRRWSSNDALVDAAEYSGCTAYPRAAWENYQSVKVNNVFNTTESRLKDSHQNIIYNDDAAPHPGAPRWSHRDSNVSNNNVHENLYGNCKPKLHKAKSYPSWKPSPEDVLILPHYDLTNSPTPPNTELMSETNGDVFMTPRLFKSRKQSVTWSTYSHKAYQRNGYQRSMSVEDTNSVVVDHLHNLQSLRTADISFPGHRITPICQRRLENKFTDSPCDKLVNSNHPIQKPDRLDVKRRSRLTKSKSETNLTVKTGIKLCKSDDEDDDYGFLSWTCNSLSSAMHKSQSPSPPRKIVPKRWRSKSRLQELASSVWSPEDSCTWSSVSGRRVTLTDTTLSNLSEAERLVLQKIAVSKLQALGLGCPVAIPKECTGAKRKRRVLRMLKRKSHSANISSLQDEIKNKEKDSKECHPMGLVFSIPLAKCIANDIELRRRRSSTQLSTTPRGVCTHHANYPARHTGYRKSSGSSISSDNPTQNGSKENINKDHTASMESLSGSDASSRITSSSLIDALSLSTNARSISGEDALRQMTSPGGRHVPHIVDVCFQHIETYGIQVLGIFRVGGSKKRIKQLHDEFDSGKEVILNSEHNCHDVAALLKEFFRDLPEPLLTRDLYSAFVATRKLESHESRVWATKLLISLLPVTSRDTLWALLTFLSNVAAHSTDSIDPQRNTLSGNKMDSYNLGIIFGPNILHKAKSGGQDEFQVEDVHRAEERKEVMAVAKHMIDHKDEIFQLPASLHDEIIRMLQTTQPDIADSILKDLSPEFCVEQAPDVFDDSDTASAPRSPISDTPFALHYPKRVPDGRPVRPHRVARPLSGTRFTTDNPRSRFIHSTSMSNLRVPDWQFPPEHDTDNNRNFTRNSYLPTSLNISSKPPPSPRLQVHTPDSGLSSASQSESTDNSPRIATNQRHEIIAIHPSQILRTSAHDLSHYPTRTDNSKTSLRNTLSPPSPYTRESLHRVSGLSSSQQRPLGIRHSRSTEWDRELWKKWEILTSGSSDDFDEQETLV